jgi:hypothetical protein
MSFLRINESGCLLRTKRGRLLTRGKSCFGGGVAICVFTQGFEHHWCVECSISDPSRDFKHVPSDTTKVSYAASLLFLPGEFDVLLRWTSGHSPYPEIQSMAAAVYGVYIPAANIPMYPDAFAAVAHVKITQENGTWSILVNGQTGTRHGSEKYMK